MSIQGEYPRIDERLLVAPAWGRVQGMLLEAGQPVEPGALVGELRENGHVQPLVAPVRGAFVSWLVRDGERVGPGVPVAVFRAIGAEGSHE